MALGAGTFSNLGAAASDLFSEDALHTRATGNRIQAQEYDLARNLANQNEQFTETSTAIKEQQAQRGIETVLGQQQADVAGSGFEASGSALDLLRDSAAQGALHKAVLGQQGLIEEAGYKEQAQSYQLMSDSANMAADQEDKAARFAPFSAALHIAGAAGSLLTGGFSLPSFGSDTDGGSPGGLPEQA